MTIFNTANILVSLGSNELADGAIYFDKKNHQLSSRLPFYNKHRTSNLKLISELVKKTINSDDFTTHSIVDPEKIKRNIAVINSSIDRHNQFVNKINSFTFIPGLRWFLGNFMDLESYERIDLEENKDFNHNFWNPGKYTPSDSEYETQFKALPEWVKNDHRIKFVELPADAYVKNIVPQLGKDLQGRESVFYIFLSKNPNEHYHKHIGRITKDHPFVQKGNIAEKLESAIGMYGSFTNEGKLHYHPNQKDYESLDDLIEDIEVEIVSLTHIEESQGHPKAIQDHGFKGDYRNLADFKSKTKDSLKDNEILKGVIFYSQDLPSYIFYMNGNGYIFKFEENSYITKAGEKFSSLEELIHHFQEQNLKFESTQW
jgi:hypothetical protein